MSNLEQIVRPFADRNVTPTRFTKPGAQASEMVRVAIGFQGTLKTISYSLSATLTLKMGQKHKEKAPAHSQALQSALRKAAGQGS